VSDDLDPLEQHLLAGLRELERQGHKVLGSAQVAGAYDIRHVSLPAALKGGAPSHSMRPGGSCFRPFS
jgi:hypothetical protein